MPTFISNLTLGAYVLGAIATGLYGDFALARYNGGGSTFGAEGRVITDFSGLADGSTAVAIQSDGRIIVTGFASRASGHCDFALGR